MRNFLRSFGFWFMVSMMMLQVYVFFKFPIDDAPWVVWFSFINGLIAIPAVVLCAQKNIWFYLFGFLQNVLYMAVVWHERLYLEFGEYIFYNITMLYGLYVWKKNIDIEDSSGDKVKPKCLSPMAWVISIAFTILATGGFGAFDKFILGGAVPYVDAFTISFTIIAQILMILCYREQWLFWFILDIASVVTFSLIGNWLFVALYIAWTVNCVYGWILWSRENRENDNEKSSLMHAAVV